ALERIVALAEPAGGCSAGALLHDVGGLVGGGMKVRRTAEHDVIAERERVRAHGRRCPLRVAALVRADVGDVMAPERALDLCEERQRSAAALGAALGGRAHILAPRDRDGRGILVVLVPGI